MVDAGGTGAVAFALYAGVLTFFAPCAYPLLPGYVGYYVSRADGESSLPRAVVRGSVAAAGVLLTLGTFVGATYLAGEAAVTTLSVLEPFVGVALIVLGVALLAGWTPSATIPLPERRPGALGFGLFGAGYAVAAAGCVAPIFLSVVALAISGPPTGGTVVVAAYAGTVAALMLATTVATGMGLFAGRDLVSRHRETLTRLAGVVLIAAGFGQLYVAYAVEVTI